jgi:PAS domain-containing protein
MRAQAASWLHEARLARASRTAMHDDLHLLEKRWSMAVQGAGFGVWDLDPRRDQVHYSPEWKGMLGYAASSAPDSTAVWRSRVHPTICSR